MKESCQFCNLANGLENANVVYETDLLCCFLDISPIHEGHTLIVPKKHILDIEESDEATRLDIINASALLSLALKKCYSPDGVSIMQNGGYFNDVNHYHMHVFPRYKNDGFGWIDPLYPHKEKATAEIIRDLQKIIKSLS